LFTFCNLNPKKLFFLSVLKNVRKIFLLQEELQCIVICVQTILSLMKNNRMESRSQLTDGHMKFVMMVVSSNLSPRLTTLSQLK